MSAQNTENTFFNNIVQMAGQVADSVSEVSHMVTQGAVNAVSTTINTVETAAENLATNIKEGVTGTIETAQEKIFGSTDVNENKEEVKEKATEIKDSIVQSATTAQQNLSNQASAVSGNMTETVSTAATKIGETAVYIKDAVVEKTEQVVEQAQQTMGSLKNTTEQKLEGAKEFVAAKAPVVNMEGIKKTAEHTYEQAKEIVSEKVEQAKEIVSEKAPAMKKNVEAKLEQAKEFVSEKVESKKSSDEIVDDITTIPLPVEVTLAAKENVVVAESLPNFTVPSKEGEWEEVKNYHTIVQENKAEKQEAIPEQPIVEKRAETNVKMVPIDDSVVVEPEGNVWPTADTIKLSNETAWTNPEKTKKIVQSLNQESTTVLAEERK